MERKLAFVFPGQGGQAAGMGRSLYENFFSSRRIFQSANSILGFDIARLCFEGPEEELVKTSNTQPALFVTSAAALAALYEAMGIQDPFHFCADDRAEPSSKIAGGGTSSPTMTSASGGSSSGKQWPRGAVLAAAAGHSVGEYAALYAAGAFSFDEGLRLVRRRGELMQQASEEHPGTMEAIIGLHADGVRKAVEMSSKHGVVDAANFNSPGQVVISGEPDAVAKASEAAIALGAKRAIPLKVGGAFHSRLMKPAAEKMALELANASISDAKVPVVANFSADYVQTATEIREALSRQIMGSVLWEDSVRKMAANGISAFIELGPGTTLAGMIKRIVPDIPTWSIGDKDSLQEFLDSLK